MSLFSSPMSLAPAAAPLLVGVCGGTAGVWPLGSYNQLRPGALRCDARFMPPLARLRIWTSNDFCVCRVQTPMNGSELVAIHKEAAEALAVDADKAEAPLAVEREEAKAALFLFLTQQGLSDGAAAELIKSDRFIDHLISVLHVTRRSHYLQENELGVLDTESTLAPYLQSFVKDHQEHLLEVIENFPNRSGLESDLTGQTPQFQSVEDSLDDVPAQVLYFMDLGLEFDEICSFVPHMPFFRELELQFEMENKVKKFVELLLDLGIPSTKVAAVLRKRPEICELNIDDLKQMMEYIKNFRVDIKEFGNIIETYPTFLTLSCQQVKDIVDFLLELGITGSDIRCLLMRHPTLFCYNLEGKIRPVAAYLQSIGVDPPHILLRKPTVFSRSVEDHLKPLVDFFLEVGFNIEEIRIIIKKAPEILTYSLLDNIIPKYDFLVEMQYPKSVLVNFPFYFNLNLDKISIRLSRIRKYQLDLPLKSVFSLTDKKFDKFLLAKLYERSRLRSNLLKR